MADNKAGVEVIEGVNRTVTNEDDIGQEQSANLEYSLKPTGSLEVGWSRIMKRMKIQKSNWL